MRANVFGLTRKVVLTVAVCFLSAILVGVARAGDKPPQLIGQWVLNPEQSDDAQQKISDAQQNSKDRASNDGGHPGGGYPGTGSPRVGIGWPTGGIGWPVGAGGGGGAGRRGGAENHRDGVSSGDWDRLAENPKSLRIDQASDHVVVSDDADHTQTFYPDGKKHEDQDASGKKVSIKSDWQGDMLVAQTNLTHSTKLTQTFRVSQDGKHLYVVSRLDAPSLQGPVSIRRVFDLMNATSQSKQSSRSLDGSGQAKNSSACVLR